MADAVSSTPAGARGARDRAGSAPAILAVAAIFALAVGGPGVTVFSFGPEALFLDMDAAWRAMAGQIPGRDYAAPYGPLAPWLTAAGFRLAGGWGGAAPLAAALATAGLGVAAAAVAATRLTPFLAIPFAAFLLALVAAPVVPGDPATFLSHAFLSERIGWAATALLIALHLAPRRAGSGADAATAAGLGATMLLAGPSWSVAAVALLAFHASDPAKRRWAGPALGATAALALAALAAGGAGVRAWAAELLVMDGLLPGPVGATIDRAFANLGDLTLFALIVALALARGADRRDAALFAACALGGFWLLSQTGPRWGILSLHAGAFVAAETLLRRWDVDPAAGRGVWANPWGVKLFALALTLPGIAAGTISSGLHAAAGLGGLGQPVGLPGQEGVRLAEFLTRFERIGAENAVSHYAEGFALLSGERPARLATLGAANPFSAGLGWPPAAGGAPDAFSRAAQARAGRLGAPVLLDGADLALEALPGAPEIAAVRAALARDFEPVAETPGWRLHRRRDGAGAAP